MKVEILYKDNSIRTIERVYKISNVSTKIENDKLLIYKINQPDIRPTVVHMEDVVCVEVKEY